MLQDVVIVMAEDDLGHAELIRRNLKYSGISNEIIHFDNGASALDFFKKTGDGPVRQDDKSYLLLLDIRMPRMSGVDVLKNLKADEELQPIPVVMLTTTDNPAEVDRCHRLGCSNYIVKPIEYDDFINALNCLGQFLRIVTLPKIARAMEVA